jgi:catechol 2,3-dioxygenase-like lactoylglutathione lyase family enzyme
MEIRGFDHVNVRTADLEAMVRWYGEVLGMRPGLRPGFDFGGAWLYCGDQALVHLVQVA